jgi:hypothetical protein
MADTPHRTPAISCLSRRRETFFMTRVQIHRTVMAPYPRRVQRITPSTIVTSNMRPAFRS